MKIINKAISLFLFFTITVLLVSCSKNNRSIGSEEWRTSTNKLIDLGYQENNLYRDFIFKYTNKPNIYETFYCLEINKLLNIQGNYLDKTKNYILDEKKNIDEKDFQNLLCIYKSCENLGLPDDDIKKRIENFVVDNNIIENLKKSDDLTSEAESSIFILSDIKSIIPDFNVKNLYETLTILQNKAMANNEKLYILNPISKLLETSDYKFNTNLKSNITTRVNDLMNKGYMYIWEIYNLIEFSINNNICNSTDFNTLTDKASEELFTGANKLSNMKLLYLLKCYNMINNSVIDNFKSDIMPTIELCELIQGGYSSQIDAKFPDDYTYLAIYIKNILNYNIKNETLDALYANIYNDLIKGNPNWKSIYRFLVLVNNKDLTNKLEKELTNQGYLKADLSVPQQSLPYYYLTMIKLNNKIDDSKLNSYINSVESSLNSTDNFDSIKSLYNCYYYSELMKSLKRKIDSNLSEKISNIINTYKNPDSNFYRINNQDNLAYTFLCISIEKNLNTYQGQNEKDKFDTDLKKYMHNDGGFIMISSTDDSPSLYNSAFGIMLEELMVQNESVPTIL